MAQQDSTNLSLPELKQVSGLLTELEYRRLQNATFIDKEAIYQSLIKDYQNGEELYKQEIANLNAKIEIVTPSWYERPTVVATITAIIIAGLCIAIK